jgi:hypothetical protein
MEFSLFPDRHGRGDPANCNGCAKRICLQMQEKTRSGGLADAVPGE